MKMVDCLSNLEKCNAECCRILVFAGRNLSQDKIKYYENHGCKIEKISHEQYQIIVPVKCQMLGDDNKCKAHDSEFKPNVCKSFKEGNTSGYFIPKECLLKKEV